ncbi:MAG: hypothetical protein ACOX7R_13070 [Acetivibrionales bacterium]
MLPLQLAGILLTGRAVLSKQITSQKSNKGSMRFNNRPRPEYSRRKALTMVSPIETLIRGVKSILPQISVRPQEEDYYSIVKSILPAGKNLIKPQYPERSAEIQLADLDGDSYNEMVASYRSDNGINTIALKKIDGKWQKITEVSNAGFDTIHFRDFADLTDQGKQQVLLGLAAKEKSPTLYGYSLIDNKFYELIKKNYQRIEVIKARNRSTGTKEMVALWDKSDTGTYDVDILGWNGSQIQPVKDTIPYYLRKVIPYYALKVKQSPHTSSNWYHLAEALSKAGLRRDALAALEVGMAQNRDLELEERFIDLKNRIMEG